MRRPLRHDPAERLARAARGFAEMRRRGDGIRARGHLRALLHAAVDALIDEADPVEKRGEVRP